MPTRKYASVASRQAACKRRAQDAYQKKRLAKELLELVERSPEEEKEGVWELIYEYGRARAQLEQTYKHLEKLLYKHHIRKPE